MRLFGQGVFLLGDFFSLLLPSLLIMLSFMIYIANKKVTYIVLISFVFMSVLVVMQPEIFRATFLVLFFTMYVLKDCSLKFVVGSLLLVSVLFIAIVFCLLSVGIIENIAFEHHGRYVYALGFGNPNTPAHFIGVTLVLAAYAIKLSASQRKRLYTFIFFASFIVFFLSIITGTRTLPMVWILFCLLVLFKNILINNISIKIIRILPILALVSFYFMATNYTNNLVATFDTLLSYRIRAFYIYLPYFSIIDMLFGNAQIVPAYDATLANSYNIIFLSNGIIIFLMFYYFYCKSIDYYFANKDYFSISILVFFALYGVTEALFIGIAFFPNLLFWILLSKTKPVSRIVVISKYPFFKRVFMFKLAK